MADDVDDLSKKREEKEENLDDAINSEIQMWQLNEIDPQQVTINAFLLDMWFFSLMEFLVEKDLIVKDELMTFYKKRLLNRLRELRPQILTQINAAKKQTLLPNTGIFGPNGEKLQ